MLLLLSTLVAFDFDASMASMQQAVYADDVAALEAVAADVEVALGEAADAEKPRLQLGYAYAKWRRAAHYERGSKPYKEILKEAEKALKNLLKREPDNAEARALNGTVQGWLSRPRERQSMGIQAQP